MQNPDRRVNAKEWETLVRVADRSGLSEKLRGQLPIHMFSGFEQKVTAVHGYIDVVRHLAVHDAKISSLPAHEFHECLWTAEFSHRGMYDFPALNIEHAVSPISVNLHFSRLQA